MTERPKAVDAVRSGLAAAGLGLGFLAGAGKAVLSGSRREGANLAATLAGGLALSAAGVELRVQGEENLWTSRPAIFLFNHQSQLDVPILAALLRRDFTGVAKESLRRHPVFGPLGNLAEVAFINRSDATEAKEQLQPVVDSLRRGVSIAIAPEGTRSPGRDVLPFKKGPFHMAIQGGVPVVPIVIRNAGEIMPAHSLIAQPGVVDVVVLAPVDTSDWVPEKAGEYAEQMRAEYQRVLDHWPDPSDER